MGNLEVGSFIRDHEQWMRQVSLCRGPIGEPGEGGPFTRNFAN